MIFNEHSNLKGMHSFFSASNYHWINDDDEKLLERYNKFKAIQQGTEDHEFASLCISRKQKLPKSARTLNLYINDAVGYRMSPEVVLRYSDKAFGTCDAIAFDEEEKILRIFDLKTGQVPASVHQLEVYAAYFCLEYDIRPGEIQIELRIYQSGEVLIFEGDTDMIAHIMDLIVRGDKMIKKRESERK